MKRGCVLCKERFDLVNCDGKDMSLSSGLARYYDSWDLIFRIMKTNMKFDLMALVEDSSFVRETSVPGRERKRAVMVAADRATNSHSSIYRLTTTYYIKI